MVHAAAYPKFQIAIAGPSSSTFPSFPSTDLSDGNVAAITLSNIRRKCNISNKFFFTADGKTRLDDQTTLEYYMTLTAEGQAILKPDASPAPAPAPESDDSEKAPPKPVPGIPTFAVQVIDDTPAKPSPLPIPEDNATMKKLWEELSKAKFLDRGALPTFDNTNLAALSANYAAIVGNATYREPAELTEADWDAVLKNNRALHGYYVDLEKGILVKAPKPAFRLRAATTPGTPTKGTEESGILKYNPSIPPFYIYDSASVSVTEIDHRTKDIFVKESFNSLAVSSSLGGGTTFPVSVSAAFEKEHATSTQETKQSEVDSLVVTYNFPRVVVELDPDCLELTPECSQDARGASSASEVDRFKRRYGTIFATSFTLGGYLFSTRSVTKDEQASLKRIKDQTRWAAGLSIQTPKFSGSFGTASTSGENSETGKATLHQEARLTWDAHGGNTLLASNPPAWIGTVKDHRLWRLMNQRRVVQLFGLIQDIDFVAYQNLIDPSSRSDNGKDPINDREFNARIRTLIATAIIESDGNSALLRKMEDYYRENNYDASPATDEYAAFVAKHYSDAPSAVIKPGIKYNGLTFDQKIYFGLFMASKGVLKFN